MTGWEDPARLFRGFRQAEGRGAGNDKRAPGTGVVGASPTRPRGALHVDSRPVPALTAAAGKSQPPENRPAMLRELNVAEQRHQAVLQTVRPAGIGTMLAR